MKSSVSEAFLVFLLSWLGVPPWCTHRLLGLFLLPTALNYKDLISVLVSHLEFELDEGNYIFSMITGSGLANP